MRTSLAPSAPPKAARRPPRAPSLPLVGNLVDYVRDPLGTVERAAAAGDLVQLDLGLFEYDFVSSPALVEEVLVTRQRIYRKDRFTQLLSRVVGNGLITSEGDFWRRQRRLAQPAFHRERVEGYARLMTDAAKRLLERWQPRTTVDLHRDLMQLTLDIVARSLFGAEVSESAHRVADAVEKLVEHLIDPLRVAFPLLDRLPLPANRRFTVAVGELDAIIYRLIAERRAERGRAGADLLSMLLEAVDQDDGTGMTDRQLRDEVMTLFLAGHETTALALSWAFFLLSRHPGARARLEEELDGVLGGRLPTLADLPRLRYTDQVIRETLRLYPPAWSIGREAIEDTSLGDYHIPKGRQIFICQWTMHRDRRWFDEPLAFRPDRWADGLAERLPKYAYFPFGGGPRLCIGQAFAQIESMLLLGALASRFRVDVLAEPPPVPQAAVTLRPRHGLRAWITARPRRR